MTRLSETNKMVDQMKEMLIKLRPEIDKKEDETNKLVKALEIEREGAAE